MEPHVEPDCRFCLANGLLDDAPLFGNDSRYFLASADPVLQHGGMIVPRRHSVTPFELTEAEWRDTFALLTEAKSFLRCHPAPMAIRLAGTSDGSVARQSTTPICTSSRASLTSLWPARASAPPEATGEPAAGTVTAAPGISSIA